MLADYVVDQKFCRAGKHEARHAVDQHQPEAQRQNRFAWLDKLPDVRQELPCAFRLFRLATASRAAFGIHSAF